MNLMTSKNSGKKRCPKNSLIELKLDFHHAGVCVNNLETAIKWYEDVLGFTLERLSEIKAVPAKVAIVQYNNLRFELFEVQDSAPLPEDRKHPNRDLLTQGNKHIAFVVEDITNTRNLLVSRGADLAFEYQQLVFFIRDNSSNLIEFVQNPDTSTKI